jgi:magnesium-transporting ATPase (P-type)
MVGSFCIIPSGQRLYTLEDFMSSTSSPFTTNYSQRHWSVFVLFAAATGALLLYLRIWSIDNSTYSKIFLRSSSLITHQNYEQSHLYGILAICFIAIFSGFCLWMITPFTQIIRGALLRWLISALSIVLLLFSLTLCVFNLIFVPPNEFQIVTVFDQYEVGLTQRYTYDPFADSSLHFTIVRSDGLSYWTQLEYVMEPRDNKRTVCTILSTKQYENQIYFLCDNEAITVRTPYLDKRNRTIYIGWGKENTERNIDLLKFE